jgi:hypothetical protein
MAAIPQATLNPQAGSQNPLDQTSSSASPLRTDDVPACHRCGQTAVRNMIGSGFFSLIR